MFSINLFWLLKIFNFIRLQILSLQHKNYTLRNSDYKVNIVQSLQEVLVENKI